MPDGTIIAAVGLIVGLIAIIKPIIDLNGNIAKLTTVVEQLEKLVKDKTDKLDERVTKHGAEIDDLKVKQAEHEARINQLESKEREHV